MQASTMIPHKDFIEQQLVKAIPLPVGHISNGTIYINIQSALGKSEAISITDEQLKAIENILLGK